MAQTANMYSPITRLDLNFLKHVAAAIGANQPPTTEPSWYPSYAPEQRTSSEKNSANTAAHGPYIKLGKISPAVMSTMVCESVL
jgi:hypothetical protein